MVLTIAQKVSIEEVIAAIISAPSSKGKRLLSAMFMSLVNKEDWPQYYELIPEPRCLNGVRASLQKGEYKNPTQVYEDLSLVFWNALFYNEPRSQIAVDAEVLKKLLVNEWKQRPVLGAPSTAPPARSAQRIHGTTEGVTEEDEKPASKPSSSKPTPSTPLPTRSSARNSAARTPVSSSQTNIQKASTASSSNNKVELSQSSIPTRNPTPDIDVENDSGAESDVGGGYVAGPSEERDQYSDEIVRQLERGLPRWPGYGEQGWMEEVSPERIIEIVHAIKSYKDVIGNRLSVALEQAPEDSSLVPNLSYTHNLSLKSIDARARSKSFPSSVVFDLEMSRLFEKARRYHEPGRESYSSVLLLQRLYNALTSTTPPPGPPYMSQTKFAHLTAGPGSPNLISDGVTLTRATVKDRTFVDSLHYKGWTLRLADWIHLSNPDDPGRPIIGQVYRCWVGTGGETGWPRKGQEGVTVVWYYRPEQTWHTSDRLFWEHEVFKTSHFADHPLADFIEKVTCQFTARHIRGRPRPPMYHPGFPLYVCDSRYNDKERIFVKIKNWRSCVPEEVRGKPRVRGEGLEERRIMGDPNDWMPIFPFERPVYPMKLRSPFVSSSAGARVKGPGGLVEGTLKELVMQEITLDNGKLVKRGSKRTGAVGGPGIWDPPDPNAVQASTAASAGGTYSGTQTPSYGGSLPVMTTSTSNPGVGKDRTILSVAGNYPASVEKLSSELGRHFDRDPVTGEVLWFAAPPVNVARPPEPRHSLEYLHFLAMKHKSRLGARTTTHDSTDSTPMDVEVSDDEGRSLVGANQPPNSAKRKPTATLAERKAKLWKEMDMGQLVDMHNLTTNLQ